MTLPDNDRALPTGRAFVNGDASVSAVPASIPCAEQRAARAIAANKRGGLSLDHPEVDKVWTSYIGQARAALCAAWPVQPATGLEAAIADFKAALPGYWFTVGECQVSADASCGPTRESPDIALIPLNRAFDDGFHADLPQPASMADALRNVTAQALEARNASHAPEKDQDHA